MANPIEVLKSWELNQAYNLNGSSKNEYEPIVYFYNPNIHPNEEYEIRKNELEKYCLKQGYELIIGDYDTEAWQSFISGLENEPEKGLRCNRCFEFRLKETAKKALAMNIKCFTTTLTVSPHKISKNIFKVGNEIAKEKGLEFIEFDFKKNNGFLKTMELAKKNNFYRQKYCGCLYSIRK